MLANSQSYSNGYESWRKNESRFNGNYPDSGVGFRSLGRNLPSLMRIPGLHLFLSMEEWMGSVVWARARENSSASRSDARSVALGGAASASVEGVGALYQNPAGTAFSTAPGFMFSTVDLTVDFRLSSAAGVVPFNDGAGAYGAFFTMLTMEPEEITTIYRPEGTGDYFDSYSSVIRRQFRLQYFRSVQRRSKS